jgi:hypothetical protein
MRMVQKRCFGRVDAPTLRVCIIAICSLLMLRNYKVQMCNDYLLSILCKNR